jgi:UDP-N-acetylglucosamine--dolichyl-phosphate N-acetylglucosaminephosphotransferase
MMDDMLGWKRGLRQWQKPIFTFFAALPIMVINAGQSTMNLPLIGSVDFGILLHRECGGSRIPQPSGWG